MRCFRCKRFFKSYTKEKFCPVCLEKKSAKDACNWLDYEQIDKLGVRNENR